MQRLKKTFTHNSSTRAVAESTPKPLERPKKSLGYPILGVKGGDRKRRLLVKRSPDDLLGVYFGELLSKGTVLIGGLFGWSTFVFSRWRCCSSSTALSTLRRKP